MLLDRGAELTVARGALRAATEGSSSLLLVAGPLGIGRSALLRELSERVDPKTVHVLRANAAAGERDFAFGVVRQLFDSVLTKASGQARERWFAGAGAARQVLDDGADTLDETILRDLRSLLAEVSATAPLLVLVDDLQWADAWSLRWLAHLGLRLEGLRMLLVCTLRDGDPGAGDPLVEEVAAAAAHVLRPRPLSLAATGELVREHLGQPADMEFVRACHETSRGNPLFLLSGLSELSMTGCRPLARNAHLARSLHSARLRDRITSCLLMQPQPFRDAAAGLAIAARDGQQDCRLVGRLAGLDDVGLATALRALHRLGLLAEGDQWRFAHPAVREAVECSMSSAELQRRHEAAAEILYEYGRPAEEVAAHLMEVPTSKHSWSVPVLRSAADAASHRGAPEPAARYLQRALLDAVEQDRTRARLLIELAAAEGSFDASAAERHIAQALPLLPTARDRATAALRLSPCVTTPLNPARIDLFRRVAEDLGGSHAQAGAGSEEAQRLEARLRYAGLCDYAQLTDAVARLRALEPSALVRSRGGRELLAVLLYASALGADGEAAEVARQARGILEWEPATAPGHGSVVHLVLLTLVGADSVQDAEPWLNAAQQSTSRDDGSLGAVRRTQRELFQLAQGRLPQAREGAQRVVDLDVAVSEERRCLYAAVLAALTLSARDAQSETRMATEAPGQLPGPVPAALLSLLQISQQARAGDAAAALDTAMHCGRQLECAGWRNPVLFPWRPWAISLSHRLGDHHIARTLAAEEYSRAKEWGAPVAIGRALRLQALTEGAGASVDLLREAVETLRGCVNELELFKAVRDLGQTLGSGAESDLLLREAGELAKSCGVPWAPAAAARMASARTAAAVLTRAESRVAALAVSGLTNREIATELRVSARAVEKHLTNSYRKLGVSGRRQLAAVLHDTHAHAHC
ncbi:ATP-binding protein [Streptomyces xantholiticus]|uniref:ATP-binding protein n=1 Tax=Streptomyces xantholiticus TaxID=68285 RepID=UPI0016731E30|nr:LuxR family transcriptional regulator [Streptomyces xantholiticus]GGW26679.1 LuxR family transcriptional regulator [Streptomyces xantholiticus]